MLCSHKFTLFVTQLARIRETLCKAFRNNPPYRQLRIEMEINMKRSLLIMTAALSLVAAPAMAQTSYGSGTPAPAAQSTSAHAAFTNILQKYVSAPDGQGLTRFNYRGLKANVADKAALDRYVDDLGRVNPATLSENEQIAFYSNLYNAVTVQVIVDNYPVSSIRKLGPLTSGPWKKKLLKINGQPASLNDVEHEILRKQFPSPYVHYMVNCASVGCPNLLDNAWEANTLHAKRNANQLNVYRMRD